MTTVHQSTLRRALEAGENTGLPHVDRVVLSLLFHCLRDENHARAMGWMTKIYERNLESTLDMFAAHQDFRWISTEITYGLYLSDRKELDDWDTELVVLVGIMVQNLRLETHWHIRGARRIGFEQKDVKTVVECVREIGEMMGCRLDRIPKVEEVEGDV